MKIKYKKLEYKDIEAFILLRLEQMKEEGKGKINNDLAINLRKYFEKHLKDGSFVSWIGVVNEKIVATSGMSFVEKPPYGCNPTGKIGLLSCMYTQRKYRRQGIASELLRRVVAEAKENGCGVVQITASDMGKLLYLNYGFEVNDNFLQLQIK